MNGIIQVSAAAIVGAVCIMTIRKQVPEIALVLSVCAGVLILLSCFGAIEQAVGMMNDLLKKSGMSAALFKPVIKTTGIAVVSKLAADLCKEANEGALATAVETAGAAFAVVAVLPLMSAVTDLLDELLLA